jgi:methionine synthase I (cobalamin-dependent)
MKPILEMLKAGEVLVSDGAMRTILFQRGLKPGECPELFNLIHPETSEEIALLYFQAGADIIGSNCGHGIDNMLEIAKQIKKISDRPIMIQSNAGLPEINGNELVYPESPSYFAEKTGELIEAGVLIIGGCCGTTPEHISAIRKVVNSTMNSN